MFNIGAPEALVIMFLALVILGPQRLPEAAKQVGRFMGEIRRMSSGFQQELKTAFDAETETAARERGAAVARPDEIEAVTAATAGGAATPAEVLPVASARKIELAKKVELDKARSTNGTTPTRGRRAEPAPPGTATAAKAGARTGQAKKAAAKKAAPAKKAAKQAGAVRNGKPVKKAVAVRNGTPVKKAAAKRATR